MGTAISGANKMELNATNTMRRTSTFFPMLFCQGSCDEQELADLMRLAAHISFSRGQTIFSEGELAESAFGLSLWCGVPLQDAAGWTAPCCGFRLACDFLAIPLVDHFSFSADAVGQVSVSRFPRKELERLIKSSNNIMQLLLEFAMRQLHATQDQLTLLGNGSAEERILTFLVNWRNDLRRVSSVSEIVPLPMRRQDIADFLGLKLEAVSRTFAKLEQRNVIRIVPHGVVLTGLEQTELVAGRNE